ncbi:MAG: U32 family peptidase [Candidatus Riflebacteria bacterium]|nr:U32 family peptidase [Candidatus Riflebacteria bacterium]
MSKPELLAPAGSADCLKAALLAGADAVYLAGKRFGARAFASNFDELGLRWARKVTKAQNKKLYITLNTIVFEHEWPLLLKTLDFMESLQPDSLIIQDIGIAVELRKRGSRIPLHLSTQGAWFGQGGVEELKELGITRVILPRETSKKEIEDIVKNSPFEIEVFVHGAMCYSISGRCFWSAALGTRSGNRGTCAQPCRREYSIDGSKSNNCVFSPKDLRLINYIKDLKQTGVASLKIEGRMKSPEYVYQVVKAYRAAIDGKNAIEEKNLDEVFSRASSNGFFYGPQKPFEWKTGNNPGREGLVVGITSGKFSDGLTELILKDSIQAGDGLFWYEGNEKKGSRITFAQRDKMSKNRIWVRGLPSGIPAKTEIRRTSKSSDENWETKWDKSMERRSIDLFWSGYEGTPLAVEAEINGHKLHLETEEKLENAMLNGLDEGPLQEKFSVIGEDYKSERHITDHLGERLHISASSLKKLKRALAENLNMLEKLPPPYGDSSLVKYLLNKGNKLCIDKSVLYSKQKPKLVLRLWNETKKLSEALKTDNLIIPWHEREMLADNKRHSDNICYWLPPVLNSKDFNAVYESIKNLSGMKFICFGWEAFRLAKLLPKLNFVLDWCFNLSNLNALAYVYKQGLSAILSKEWKEEDIPENLNLYRASFAWNPLVSYTRFKEAFHSEQIVSNSHKDKFFVLNIGSGVNAMFLEDHLSMLPKLDVPLMLDVAISPKENPIQASERLNRIIERFM